MNPSPSLENHCKFMLLVQFSTSPAGAFFEYPTQSELFDGLCQIYERGLRICLQGKTNVTYELDDLINYIDSLPSLRAFVHKTGVWQDFDKDWIKSGLSSHLRQQAMGG